MRKDYIGHGWAPPKSGGKAETALADAMSRFFVELNRGRVGRRIFPVSEGEREKKIFYMITLITLITGGKNQMNPEYEEFEERYFGGDYAAFCDEYGPETEAVQ